MAILQANRYRTRIKRNVFQYWKCGAKTITFIFWASLYMMVMKLTIFKSNAPPQGTADWSLTDNYTRWLLQGPVLGQEEPEEAYNTEWLDPDNKTVDELEARATNVQRVCQKWNLYNDKINNKEFFVDHEHNLVWCNIFKAASSSWLYKLNVLGGYDRKYLERTRHNPLTLARNKFPRPSEDEVRDAVSTPGVISLLVVREPFIRLLSAYRDKLENITPPYYRKLARAIVAKYRETSNKLFGNIKSYGPTFYEFVAYLVEKYKQNDKQFIVDEHWAPYYKFCSPCAVNFSVIAKVESLSRDSAYVINQLGLSHVLHHKVRDRKTRLRTVMNKSKDGRNTSALIKHYYSQLNDEMLNDLLKIYGIDFEMFGYDSDVYKKYISNKIER